MNLLDSLHYSPNSHTPLNASQSPCDLPLLHTSMVSSPEYKDVKDYNNAGVKEIVMTTFFKCVQSILIYNPLNIIY